MVIELSQVALIALPLLVAGITDRTNAPSLVSLSAAALVATIGANAFPEIVIEYLIGVEGLIAATCVLLWTFKGRMRAHAISVISVLKMGVGFVCMFDVIPWLLFAVAFNVGFILQAFIAGGLLDNVGHWIDNRMSRICPRRLSLLRNGF